jgi:hypothetical protein
LFRTCAIAACSAETLAIIAPEILRSRACFTKP